MFNSFLCSKLTGISDSHRTLLPKHEGPPYVAPHPSAPRDTL